MLGALELACSYRAWNRQKRRQHEDKERKVIKRDIKKIAGRARLGEEEFISLESVMAEFKLSNNTLRRMMSHMSDNMDRGLEGGLEKSTIAMLPSFVPELPDGTERGKFVAMDLGGTNLRVMIMEIEPGEKMRTKQFNTRMPNAAMHGTGEQLFDYIAKALADFLIEKDLANENLPVGFTFSYPCDQTSLRSATLLRWTKGVTATGVVGKNVVTLLEEAIERDGRVKVEVVALINDTVGTMVAAAYEANGACDIGVIIGTGTNASYMEDAKAIKHGLANASEPYHHKQMIIDTEWGGFGDNGEAEYIFTQYDKIVDARSDHPGVNSLDKLVAGMCMGEVVRLVLEKLCTHKVLFNGNGSKILYTVGSFPTKYISEILHDDCGSYSNTRQIMDELNIDDYTFSDMLLFREVCLVVSRRSANLSAAAIACVLNRVRRPNMVVAIDGSTYKYHPFFDHWVVEKIRELIDPGLEFKVVQTGDGSGKGAALIAAIVTRVRRAEEKRKKDEAARAAREAEEAEKRRKKEQERLRLEAEEREREKQAEEERARKLEELMSYGEDRVKEEQNTYVTIQD
ncbi:Phosphotransferase [Trichostrongylus colubriformis]|uniref:Phosphotransferase n=1 Tax=Trichostrongylus colubriformis TaxID=6319 RepID=A0AAN8IEQ0_TRICO